MILDEAEIFRAAVEGCKRHSQNLHLGHKGDSSHPEYRSWQDHIEGAIAELALSKYLGIPWVGKGNRGDPDVGKVDCRHTKRRHGRLIVRHFDNPRRQQWLVTGSDTTYDIVGWIWGFQAMKRDWWTDPNTNRPAFFVDRRHLYPPFPEDALLDFPADQYEPDAQAAEAQRPFYHGLFEKAQQHCNQQSQ